MFFKKYSVSIIANRRYTSKQPYQIAVIGFLPVIDVKTQILIGLICLCVVMRNYFPFWKEFLGASFMGFLVFIAPIVNFFLTSILSCIIVLLSVSYFDRFFSKRKKLASDLWNLLFNLGLINYFIEFYYKFFSQRKLYFYMQTVSIYSFCIIYLLISKYLFLYKDTIFSLDLLSYYFLYMGLVLGILAFYIRSLLFLSILIVDLQSVFLLGDLERDSDDMPKNTKADSLPKTGNSLLSFHRHTHQHNHYEHVQGKVSFFKRAGFGVAILGLGITGYATYQQRLQTIAAQDSLKVAQDSLKAAQDSLKAQEVNNFEMQRQNDLEEVAQGLLSKEDYYHKYKKK